MPIIRTCRLISSAATLRECPALLLAAFEVSGTVAAYSVEELADDLIEIEEIPETSENPDTGVTTVNAVALSATAASLMLIAASKKAKKTHR